MASVRAYTKTSGATTHPQLGERMTNVEQAASGAETITRLGRIAYRIFGRERLDRWLAEPPRCEWVTPSSRLRCFRKAGHSGSCLTETTRTNTQTGKAFTVRREWYGVNYSEEGA